MLDSISKDYKMTNDDPYRDCAALTYGPTISLWRMTRKKSFETKITPLVSSIFQLYHGG
jgi:hypothetical protein